jgi:hypothetical protein
MVILLDRLNNLSKLAHDFFSNYASRRGCHGRRASSLSVLLRQLCLDRQNACLP